MYQPTRIEEPSEAWRVRLPDGRMVYVIIAPSSPEHSLHLLTARSVTTRPLPFCDLRRAPWMAQLKAHGVVLSE